MINFVPDDPEQLLWSDSVIYIYIYIHLVSKEHLMNLGMKAINGECTEYQSGEQ